MTKKELKVYVKFVKSYVLSSIEDEGGIEDDDEIADLISDGLDELAGMLLLEGKKLTSKELLRIQREVRISL